MGQGFKEVASLRGDEKKFQENFAKIDWSGVTKNEEKKENKCSVDCRGCSCHISPPCSHCVDHINYNGEEDI